MADFEHDIHITFVPWEKRHDAIADSDWVVNSTPVGMHPNVDASPVDDAGCFQAGQLVQDLIYPPSPTRLLKMAADKGCTVQDGLAMLVGQGPRHFAGGQASSRPSRPCIVLRYRRSPLAWNG